MSGTAFDNLEMGPCTAFFKAADLGLTKGGCEVQIATESTLITADQFGDTAIDEIIKGRKVTVKVPMAERDLAKLVTVIPGSVLVTGTGADLGKKKLTLSSGVGVSLRAGAGPLVLHPIAMAEGDKSKDFVLPLANAKGDIQFSYKVDDQRVYTVEFTGYVDLTTGTLAVFGDPALASS
jgi:hypothetical protein